MGTTDMIRIAAVGLVMWAPACGDDSDGDASSAVTTAVEEAESDTTTGATETTLAVETDPSVSEAPPGATTVTMVDFAFSPLPLTVSGGDGAIVLFLVNSETPQTEASSHCGMECRDHSMSIRNAEGRSVAISDRVVPGSAALFTVEGLAPGQYVFVCPVPGHLANFDMQGTLEVTA